MPLAATPNGVQLVVKDFETAFQDVADEAAVVKIFAAVDPLQAESLITEMRTLADVKQATLVTKKKVWARCGSCVPAYALL